MVRTDKPKRKEKEKEQNSDTLWLRSFYLTTQNRPIKYTTHSVSFIQCSDWHQILTQ